MKVELKFLEDGKEVTKTYVNDYVSALIYKEYNKLEQEFNALIEEPTIDQYDKLIGLLCKAFNNQFTIDDYWSGSSTFTLRKTLYDFILTVKGIPLEPTEEDLEKAAEKEKEGNIATP